jgi:hypothetical protein
MSSGASKSSSLPSGSLRLVGNFGRRGSFIGLPPSHRVPPAPIPTAGSDSGWRWPRTSPSRARPRSTPAGSGGVSGRGPQNPDDCAVERGQPRGTVALWARQRVLAGSWSDHDGRARKNIGPKWRVFGGNLACRRRRGAGFSSQRRRHSHWNIAGYAESGDGIVAVGGAVDEPGAEVWAEDGVGLSGQDVPINCRLVVRWNP